MADLSPAAQAVLDVFTEDNSLHDRKHNYYNLEALAAALRAAADQVVPALDPDDPGPVLIDAERNRARRQLLAIAAELENTNG